MNNLKAYALLIDPDSPTDAKLVSELAARGYMVYQPVRGIPPEGMDRAFVQPSKQQAFVPPSKQRAIVETATKKAKPKQRGKRRARTRTNTVNGRGVLEQLIAMVGQRHLVPNDELELSWLRQVDRDTGRKFSIQSLRFILEKLRAVGLVARSGNGGVLFTQPAVSKLSDRELRDMLARVGSHWH